MHRIERTDARVNRERLLDAAVMVFAERGIEAEMREIAERAGLAIGTIYRHFESKDALIAAIISTAVAEFEQVLDRALAEADPIEGIRRLVRGGIAVVERYGDMITAMLQDRTRAVHEAIDDRRRAAIRDRSTLLISRGIAAGVFRADLDVELTSLLLRLIFVPALLLDLRRDRTADQLAEAILDQYLYGVAVAPR